MYGSILVPLDGSDLAERALPLARFLADSSKARLLLLRVAPPPPFPDRSDPAERDRALAEAEEYLAALAPVPSSSRAAEVIAVGGDPAEVVPAVAQSEAADLIVMSTHGRSGASALTHGSVAGEVLRRTTVPVLALPANAGAFTGRPIERVLVALDGSKASEAALPAALAFAEPFHAEVLLLRVIGEPPPVRVARSPDAFPDASPSDEAAAADLYLWRLGRELQAQGQAVRTLMEVGDPGAVIADTAVAERADAIAMATHGRSGVGRFVLGSAATATLQVATVPVLLVKEPSIPSEA